MPLIFMVLFRSIAFLFLVGAAAYGVHHSTVDFWLISAVVVAAVFWQATEWLQSVFMRNG